MSHRALDHHAFARHPLTGWTCRIIDCDVAGAAPKACVLLLVSAVMMLAALIVPLVLALT